jgi:hypothetical protein
MYVLPHVQPARLNLFTAASIGACISALGCSFFEQLVQKVKHNIKTKMFGIIFPGMVNTFIIGQTKIIIVFVYPLIQEAFQENHKPNNPLITNTLKSD